MPRAFVIRGFGTKKDSAGQPVDFERVQDALITPALHSCGLAGGTTAEVVDAGNIRADMFALILEADVVICDVTVHNANVFYELGIRHALRKKHTVLLKGDPSADTTPFDLSTDRYLKYPVANPAAALDALVETLQASLRTNRETDSPIFLMLPKLAEADLSDMTIMPLDFIEEVQRAEAAGDKGWLRVIAEDLRGLRFQWDGLRRVARAQWSLKDLGGARQSWEELRRNGGDDVEANLALANMYEREYRATDRETLLESSNQAIRWVLAAKGTTAPQRAEALALQGRNLKTMWRARFAGQTDPVVARQQAVDGRAWQSYQSYREAFECDLNAFYPGVAALQMGHILQLLAQLPTWRNLFRGDRLQADRARQDLETELPALTSVVSAAIKRATRLPDTDRLWAHIADADLLFLTLPEPELQANPELLVQAYREAIPPNRLFAWDATSGQLALFAQLGHRAEAVRAVMNAFAPGTDPSKPVRDHLIVFAGHRIDADSALPRFPAASEARARTLIAERLRTLITTPTSNETVTVLASAAPGADLLVHEVARELGVRCRLCLPMPAEAVARLMFGAADEWRTRFLNVVDAHQKDLLQLDDHPNLARWLQGRAGIDPWERGNRWVMHMAETWGAARVTLMVLWDGQDDGSNGSTAHMVRLARALGRFELSVIDSRQLLA
jgi:hypothetical protein